MQSDADLQNALCFYVWQEIHFPPEVSEVSDGDLQITAVRVRFGSSLDDSDQNDFHSGIFCLGKGDGQKVKTNQPSNPQTSICEAAGTFIHYW